MRLIHTLSMLLIFFCNAHADTKRSEQSNSQRSRQHAYFDYFDDLSGKKSKETYLKRKQDYYWELVNPEAQSTGQLEASVPLYRENFTPEMLADYEPRLKAVGELYAKEVPGVLEELQTQYHTTLIAEPPEGLQNYFSQRISKLLPQKQSLTPPTVAEQRARNVVYSKCLVPSSEPLPSFLQNELQKLSNYYEDEPFDKFGLRKGAEEWISPEEWTEVSKKLEVQLRGEIEANYAAFSRFVQDNPHLFPELSPDEYPRGFQWTTLHSHGFDIKPHFKPSRHSAWHLAFNPGLSLNHNTLPLLKLSAKEAVKRDIVVKAIFGQTAVLVEFLDFIKAHKVPKPMRLSAAVLNPLKRKVPEILKFSSHDLSTEGLTITQPHILTRNPARALEGGSMRSVVIIDGLLNSPTYWVDREEEAKNVGRPGLIKHMKEIEKNGPGTENARKGKNKKDGVRFERRIPKASEDFMDDARNIPLEKMNENKKKVAYRIRRANRFEAAFYEMGSVNSSSLQDYSIAVSADEPISTDLHTPSAEFDAKHNYRMAIPTKRGERLKQISLHAEPTGAIRSLFGGSRDKVALELEKDYRVLKDARTGTYVVELLNKDYADASLTLDASFSEPVQAPRLLAKHYILNPKKLYLLIRQLEEAGFTELAGALKERIALNLKNQKSITLDVISDVFRTTGYYSLMEEGAARGALRNNPFQAWTKFLIDGKLYGQCTAAQQLSHAFLQEYYKDDPDIRVEYRKGYLNQSSHYLKAGDGHAMVVIVQNGVSVHDFEGTSARQDPRIRWTDKMKALFADTWEAMKERVQSVKNWRVETDLGWSSNQQAKANSAKAASVKISMKEVAEKLTDKRQRVLDAALPLKLRNIPNHEPLPRLLKMLRVAEKILQGQMELKEANQELNVIFPKSSLQCKTKQCILSFIVENSKEVYAQQEKMRIKLEKDVQRSQRTGRPLARTRAQFQNYFFVTQYPMNEAHDFLSFDLKNALQNPSFIQELEVSSNQGGPSCALQVSKVINEAGL